VLLDENRSNLKKKYQLESLNLDPKLKKTKFKKWFVFVYQPLKNGIIKTFFLDRCRVFYFRSTLASFERVYIKMVQGFCE